MRASSRWNWDHVSAVLSGQGSEEVNKDFNFFLTATFIKPLERHVDEMRRLDAAEGGEAHYRVIQQDCQL